MTLPRRANLPRPPLRGLRRSACRACSALPSTARAVPAAPAWPASVLRVQLRFPHPSSWLSWLRPWTWLPPTLSAPVHRRLLANRRTPLRMSETPIKRVLQVFSLPLSLLFRISKFGRTRYKKAGKFTPRRTYRARLTVASTQCEYPVTHDGRDSHLIDCIGVIKLG